MKILGTTIECYRGETFSFKKEIVNKDGTPFIVKPDDLNPYIKLSVSSNIYPIDGRYKKNYYLDLSTVRRYKGYELLDSDDINSLDTDFIYYKITPDGREYYFIEDGVLKDYSFLYIKEFKNFDTKKWIGQIYTYDITYVCGISMTTWLKGVYLSLYDEPLSGLRNNISNEEFAHYICKKRPDLLIGVDITEPLSSYTSVIPIQKPCKLVVKEN